MLAGIRVVKAFAQEPREFDRFQRSSEYLRRSRVTVEQATASFSAIMALIFSLGGLIVWYVGGRDVLAGKMTLGSLMAFLAYLAMFYAPLSTLSQLTTWLTSFMTGCSARLRTARYADRDQRARPAGPVAARSAARSALKTSPSATSDIDRCSRKSISRFDRARRSASSVTAAAAKRRS